MLVRATDFTPGQTGRRAEIPCPIAHPLCRPRNRRAVSDMHRGQPLRPEATFDMEKMIEALPEQTGPTIRTTAHGHFTATSREPNAATSARLPRLPGRQSLAHAATSRYVRWAPGRRARPTGARSRRRTEPRADGIHDSRKACRAAGSANQADEQPHQPSGADHAECAAGRYQHRAFGDELTEQTTGRTPERACAPRSPACGFPRAPAAGWHVQSRDRQQQPRAAQQQ